MKNNEEEITKKIIAILTELQGDQFDQERIKKVVFHESNAVARPRGETIDTWVAVIDEPLFDSTEFFVLSDKTGEPLYYQTKHEVLEIIKNDEGKYVVKLE